MTNEKNVWDGLLTNNANKPIWHSFNLLPPIGEPVLLRAPATNDIYPDYCWHYKGHVELQGVNAKGLFKQFGATHWALMSDINFIFDSIQTIGDLPICN